MAAAGAQVLGGTLAIGALALAGCGGSGDSVAEAAKRTLAAPGARFMLKGVIRLPGRGRPISFTGRGWLDNRAHRTRVRLSGGVRGDEILAGNLLYLRFPNLTGKRWVRVDVRKQRGRPGFNAGSVVLNQANPTRYLSLLRSGRKLARPAQVSVEGGYVRQIRVAYSVGVPGQQGRIAYRTTVRFSDFGRQPAIALPPTAKVTEQ